uniref:Homeobox domain-containing protein n=1 Tax=Hucho hucho TaxID=62062 RepID=A0A4W5K722_9TELE
MRTGRKTRRKTKKENNNNRKKWRSITTSWNVGYVESSSPTCSFSKATKSTSTDSSSLMEIIKHWFRNTLFKERQRSKDSPYNFNIPPITTLEDIRLESQYSTLEYYRTDATMNKRSSRTRFTDYQLRVLQDFFDTNAYPKDDEIEQLSTVLNLPSRVIVVWFQNARQKARKSYENQFRALGPSQSHKKCPFCRCGTAK